MGGLVLGIDGGDSKTTALLADQQGKVLGKGLGEGSNYRTVGLEKAFAALDQAVSSAIRAAGDPQEPVVAVVLGLAGIDQPEDAVLFEPWRDRHFPGSRLQVVNESRLVLAAGTLAGWGIVLISGTGTLIYAQSSLGWTARADGWGYLLGDEGSGYDIGRKALLAVMRAYDRRGPETALTDFILDTFSVAQPSDLVHEIYSLTDSRPTIARLAQLVDQAAQDGDMVASALLGEAGYELALGAKAAADRLGLSSPVPAALAGGVLINSQMVRRNLLEAAEQLGLKLDPVVPVEEPALGAIILARRLLDLE